MSPDPGPAHLVVQSATLRLENTALHAQITAPQHRGRELEARLGQRKVGLWLQAIGAESDGVGGLPFSA